MKLEQIWILLFQARGEPFKVSNSDTEPLLEKVAESPGADKGKNKDKNNTLNVVKSQIRWIAAKCNVLKNPNFFSETVKKSPTKGSADTKQDDAGAGEGKSSKPWNLKQRERNASLKGIQEDL